MYLKFFNNQSFHMKAQSKEPHTPPTNPPAAVPITGNTEPMVLPMVEPIVEHKDSFPFFLADSLIYFPLNLSTTVPTTNPTTPTRTFVFAIFFKTLPVTASVPY